MYLIWFIFIVIAVAGFKAWLRRRARLQFEAYARSRGLIVVDPPADLVQLVRGAVEGGRDYTLTQTVASSQPKVNRNSPPHLNHIIFSCMHHEAMQNKNKSIPDKAVLFWPVDANFPKTSIGPALKKRRPTATTLTTEWEEFNRTFLVESESYSFGHALLNPLMQEYLMSHTVGLEMKIGPGAILLVISNWDVTHWDRITEVAAGFEEKVLPFLWKQFY